MTRLICGLGVGQASAITPLYVSENAPRAIRGGLTGLYQLFIVSGIMLAFWINYGSKLNITGDAIYIVPLTMQCLPALLLFGSMFFCNETPRFLAKQDRWEESKQILSQVRHLPIDHPYVQNEFQEICEVIEQERALIGGATFKDLQKEMWTIPGNRKRSMIAIVLMICQQMTGTNATTTPQRSSRIWASGATTQVSSQRESMASSRLLPVPFSFSSQPTVWGAAVLSSGLPLGKVYA
jgi:MFS family permease